MPAGASGLHPLRQAASEPELGAGRRPVGPFADERPHALTALDDSLVLKFPVGLVDGVRIDRNLGHHLFDRGKPVAHLEHAGPDCLANLFRQLQVRGHTGVGPELEGEQLAQV